MYFEDSGGGWVLEREFDGDCDDLALVRKKPNGERRDEIQCEFKRSVCSRVELIQKEEWGKHNDEHSWVDCTENSQKAEITQVGNVLHENQRELEDSGDCNDQVPHPPSSGLLVANEKGEKKLLDVCGQKHEVRDSD